MALCLGSQEAWLYCENKHGVFTLKGSRLRNQTKYISISWTYFPEVSRNWSWENISLYFISCSYRSLRNWRPILEIPICSLSDFIQYILVVNQSGNQERFSFISYRSARVFIRNMIRKAHVEKGRVAAHIPLLSYEGEGTPAQSLLAISAQGSITLIPGLAFSFCSLADKSRNSILK